MPKETTKCIVGSLNEYRSSKCTRPIALAFDIILINKGVKRVWYCRHHAIHYFYILQQAEYTPKNLEIYDERLIIM
jgi:hypothetical protein